MRTTRHKWSYALRKDVPISESYSETTSEEDNSDNRVYDVLQRRDGKALYTLKRDVPKGQSSIEKTLEQDDIEVVAILPTKESSPKEHVLVPIGMKRKKENKEKTQENFDGCLSIEEFKRRERELEVGVLHNSAREKEIFHLMDIRKKARETRLRCNILEEEEDETSENRLVMRSEIFPHKSLLSTHSPPLPHCISEPPKNIHLQCHEKPSLTDTSAVAVTNYSHNLSEQNLQPHERSIIKQKPVHDDDLVKHLLHERENTLQDKAEDTDCSIDSQVVVTSSINETDQHSLIVKEAVARVSAILFSSVTDPQVKGLDVPDTSLSHSSSEDSFCHYSLRDRRKGRIPPSRKGGKGRKKEGAKPEGRTSYKRIKVAFSGTETEEDAAVLKPDLSCIVCETEADKSAHIPPCKKKGIATKAITFNYVEQVKELDVSDTSLSHSSSEDSFRHYSLRDRRKGRIPPSRKGGKGRKKEGAKLKSRTSNKRIKVAFSDTETEEDAAVLKPDLSCIVYESDDDKSAYIPPCKKKGIATKAITFNYEEETYIHPLREAFKEGELGEPDFDSILVAVDLEKFSLSFPLFLNTTLQSKCGSCRDLQHYTLCAVLCGYNVYVKISYEQKEAFCNFVRNHGPMCIPSTNTRTFITGTILCSAFVFLMGLARAGITFIVLQGYGMKAPLEFMEELAPLVVNIDDVPQRVDVGVNGSCDGIPLFTCSKGEVFPMFHSSGYGYGSVLSEHEGLPDVRVVTYPLLLHSVKALIALPSFIPKRSDTIINKRKILKRAMRDLSKQGEKLHGYRIEYQFRSQLSIHEILSFAKKLKPKLPKHVSCHFLMETKTYHRMCLSYFLHCKEIFKGRKGEQISRKQLRLYCQLLNVFGLWSHLIAFHVVKVPVKEEPSFIRALLNASSAVPYFPKNAGKVKQLKVTVIDPQDIDYTDTLLKDIQENLYVRKHMRTDYVCAVNRKSRGITKCFKTKEELYQYIKDMGGKKWKTTYKTK